MRMRLILSFIVVAAVAILSMTIIARQSAAGEVRSFMFPGGMDSAENIAASLEKYYAENGSWSGVEQFLLEATPGRLHGRSGMNQGQGMLGQGMMGQRLRVANGDGIVVADTSSETAGKAFTQLDINSSLVLEVRGDTIGYFLAEGGMGFTRRDETYLVSRITRAALIAAMIAGGVSLFLAFFLAYQLLRPVQALTRAAQAISHGSLQHRVSVHGNDELSELGRTFNRMAESLQKYEESRKAMTADIAHELRNPLAVQRATLEAMIDGVYPLTTENLAPVLEQNQTLTHLVDDLRTLALADAGEIKLDKTPTSLPVLSRKITEQHMPIAEKRQIHLSMKTNQDAEEQLAAILLDPIRIEQILGNLLSNALRYTPDGGSIQIGLDVRGGSGVLTVHDSGPGIPEDSLPYVFDRFYRVSKSRSRSEGGSGLGLAIARHMAQAHNGSLEAENHPRGGAVLTLILPITPSRD